MTQETLEEAASSIIPDRSTAGWIDSFGATERIGFIKGAKWQQERMYSEEEVEMIARDAYEMGRKNILIGVFNKWFKQFKKK
jgi:hypothetical protein